MCASCFQTTFVTASYISGTTVHRFVIRSESLLKVCSVTNQNSFFSSLDLYNGSHLYALASNEHKTFDYSERIYVIGECTILFT